MAIRPSTLLFAALLCLSASAQGPAPQPERRTFAVSVLDKDANAVRGLTAANFRGTFRGQPVKILSATEDSSPRRIALTIDVSGSMMEKEQWPIAWTAAKYSALSVGAENKIELFSLGESLKQYGQLTWRDEKELAAALDLVELSARNPKGGGTALCDGILEIAAGLSNAPFGSVIYLITDGVDTSSKADGQDVEAELSRRGIRLYVLQSEYGGTPSFVLRSSRFQIRRVTKDMVSLTGGRMLVLRRDDPKLADVPARMLPLSESLSKVYRIEVEFPLIEKHREWKLEVVDANGKPRNDIDVAYPRLLVPAKKK